MKYGDLCIITFYKRKTVFGTWNLDICNVKRYIGGSLLVNAEKQITSRQPNCP